MADQLQQSFTPWEEVQDRIDVIVEGLQVRVQEQLNGVLNQLQVLKLVMQNNVDHESARREKEESMMTGNLAADLSKDFPKGSAETGSPIVRNCVGNTFATDSNVSPRVPTPNLNGSPHVALPTPNNGITKTNDVIGKVFNGRKFLIHPSITGRIRRKLEKAIETNGGSLLVTHDEHSNYLCLAKEIVNDSWFAQAYLYELDVIEAKFVDKCLTTKTLLDPRQSRFKDWMPTECRDFLDNKMILLRDSEVMNWKTVIEDIGGTIISEESAFYDLEMSNASSGPKIFNSEALFKGIVTDGQEFNAQFVKN